MLSKKNEKRKKPNRNFYYRFIKPLSQGGFICSHSNFPAGIFFSCFSALKQQQIPAGKYDLHVWMAANEFIRLISQN